MRVVIAPDSFKGSCDSPAAAAAIAAGWRRGAPDWETVSLPVADGGEGTLHALVGSLGGRIVRHTVTGPNGQPVSAELGLIPAEEPGGPLTGVVEMASASGLHLVEPTPASAAAATSYGTGELIRAALDAGAERLLLTLGGSATTDGGAGMAQALGVRFSSSTGASIAPGGVGLQDIAAVDLSGVHPGLARCEVVAACDVDSPLHGPRGAAYVFGPQKGAEDATVRMLDDGLRRLGEVCGELADPATPGAGAAGGLGFAALAFLGADLRSGFELVADAVGLASAIAGADLVITGEGRLDTQSLGGKTPVGVMRLAQAHDVPVVVIAGDVSQGADQAIAAGMTAVFSAAPGPGPLHEALDRVESDLSRTAESIARVWGVAAGARL
ncbi:glycerate kinase [Nocardioides panzhihuensis]|uniref:Glycerate kinase n=1 Tax=Nocardioides panzhihuensis TaxID=860243 RepID=A0A7Z0DLE1_9ACTN|nr:glycerate kinase [Nocardioides panzhihuensis]